MQRSFRVGPVLRRFYSARTPDTSRVPRGVATADFEVPRALATADFAQLFVSNLPASATDSDVKKKFSVYFDIEDCKISYDNAGKSRGYAFVTVDSKTKRLVCETMNGAVFNGQQMSVEVTTPIKRPPKVSDTGRLEVGDDPKSKRAQVVLNKRLRGSKSAAEVLAIYDQCGTDFNVVNLATALHLVGTQNKRFAETDAPLLQQLVDEATESIWDRGQEWESRHLANACWGLAKLQSADGPAGPASRAASPALFKVIAKVAAQRARAFNAQDMANIVWAYATAGETAATCGPLFETVAEEAGIEAPQLFKDVALEASRKIVTFNPQALANTLWAFAKLGVPAPALFFTVAAEATAGEKIAAFKAQNLANTVWAFAKAGVEAPSLFAAVALQVPPKLPGSKPQNLANTVWAFATAGVEAPLMFVAVAAETRRKLPMYNAHDMANTVWAYAKAGVSAPELFEAVAAEALTKMPKFHSMNYSYTDTAQGKELHDAPLKTVTFDSHDLAVTAWAYATAGVEAPQLFEALAAEAAKKIAMFNAHELALTVWAFAKAGVDAPQLFDAVAAEVPKRAFTAHDLESIAWAYSMAGVAAPQLLEAVAAEAPSEIT